MMDSYKHGDGSVGGSRLVYGVFYILEKGLDVLNCLSVFLLLYCLGLGSFLLVLLDLVFLSGWCVGHLLDWNLLGSDDRGSCGY